MSEEHSSGVTYLPNCVPLPINKDLLIDLVEKAKDWAVMHGAAMRPKNNFSPDALEYAPFVLFPSVIPSEDFQTVLRIQSVFNELVHKVACNKAFLKNCLSNVLQVDEFTRKLFNIYEIVENEGVVQPISLGLLRCDWMLKPVQSPASTNYKWKQVEINTIASGFGWLGPASRNIHEFVLQELDQQKNIKNLPENNALSGLCQGMISAWKLYGNPKAVILFVIEDVSYNICDQRFHEFEIRKLNPKVKVLRRTLTEISKVGYLSKEKNLILDNQEVAVVYFRAGYHPSHYPSDKEWDARLLIERSMAIKCPTIHYHLTGTKKIQQELARPGILEMFLKSSQVGVVRDLFAELYSLDFDEMGDSAIDLGLKSPDRYVLKPQREGGGNNLYGNDLKEALFKMRDSNERCAWILMEKIECPITKGYMVRAGGPNPPPLIDMVSELGIFGVIIAKGEDIVLNEQVGHMLRTKSSSANEGGVAAGDGALDSPFLLT